MAGSCGGGRWHCQRRWTAGAEWRLTGGEPKLVSRLPFHTERAPKGRGRLEELTGSLGREVEATVEEIDGKGGRRGSGSGEASGSARRRGEKGKWCGRIRGWCPPFIQGGGAGGRAQRRWAAGTPVATIKARWRPWCVVVTGGRGRGRRWVVPGECTAH
jgi:hypothetical protein